MGIRERRSCQRQTDAPGLSADGYGTSTDSVHYRTKMHLRRHVTNPASIDNVRSQHHRSSKDWALVARAEKRKNGGPQMIDINIEGKRVYFTNSLCGAIDDQFYRDGVDC